MRSCSHTGQTEQEYLGRYLHVQNWMYCVSEEKFNLENALHDFQKAEFEITRNSGPPLKAAVQNV